MATLVYRAESVGPVCKRLCKTVDGLQFVRDNKPVPEGLVVRWGSVWPPDGQVRQSLNSAESVAVAKDKIETRKRLGVLAPPTWFRRQDIPDPEQMTVIVRPGKHHAGKRFYVCSSAASLDKAIRKCGASWYASLLIEKAHEYRVFVCQGRIVAVSERFPAEDAIGAGKIAWNLAMGGKLINVRYNDWPLPVCKTAISACDKLGLDWGAIDLTVDTGGDVWVFEANTAPGLRNPFTMKQIAKTFVWAGENKSPKPVKGETWQSLMHPALKSSR